MNIKWNRQTLTVTFGRYPQGAKARWLQLSESDGTYAKGTYNPDLPIPEDMVAIKDVAENAGLMAALIAGGVISEPEQYVRVGNYAKVPVCRLTAEALAAAER